MLLLVTTASGPSVVTPCFPVFLCSRCLEPLITIGTIGCDTLLSSADFDGINFIAIQALEKRTSRLQSENEQLKEELAMLRSEMERFESLLQKVEDLSARDINRLK